MRSPFTWSAARPKSNSAPTPPPICIVCVYLLRTHSDGSLTSTTKHDSVAGAIAKSFSGHLFRCGSYTIVSMGSGSSHLACGHELKRAERDLEVGGVRLEVVESSRNAGLELGRALARGARGRDLVEGAHGCGGCRCEDWERRCEIQKGIFFCCGLVRGASGPAKRTLAWIGWFGDFGMQSRDMFVQDHLG